MADPQSKLVNHLDDVNAVATEYLKGLTPTEISQELSIPRVRVMSLLKDWREMVSDNQAIHARARELLAGMDQHYGILISKTYEVIESADQTANLQAKTTAIKLIADIEAKRLDMLHRAGLLDNREIAEELARMEQKHEVIINLLKSIAQRHPEIRMEILEGLSQANGSSEAIVIDNG